MAQYVVISRAIQKDFNDEKLEEMEQALLEVLIDRDAQVIFEPYDDDFSQDGAVEIQVLVQNGGRVEKECHATHPSPLVGTLLA